MKSFFRLEIVETEAVPLQESRTRQTVANLLMVKNRPTSANVPSSGKNLLLAEIVPRIGRQPLGIDHQLARNGPGTGLLVKGKYVFIRTSSYSSISIRPLFCPTEYVEKYNVFTL